MKNHKINCGNIIQATRNFQKHAHKNTLPKYNVDTHHPHPGLEKNHVFKTSGS